MKTTIKFGTVIFHLVTFLFISASATAQKSKSEKNKFLDNKKYDAQFYEIKPTGRGKAVKTLLFIKSGKIESDLTFEKLSLPPVPCRVILDSTYTEDDTEMRMVTIEADYSEDKNDYKWEATIINYEIEGTVVQMKSGVEKKKYEFTGVEKTKK